jgi:hypothetical protein
MPYLLPEILTPLSRRCVSFYIPNETWYIAAFFGAISELANTYMWEGNQADKLIVTELWEEIIATARQSWELGDCELPIEFRMNDGYVEWRPDSSAGWISLGLACPCEESNLLPLMEYDTEKITTQEIACAISVGLVNYIFDKMGDLIDKVGLAADVASVVDTVFLVFPPAYLIADFISDMAREFVNVGLSEMQVFDDVDRREEMSQYLYCAMRDTGEMTNEIWDDFKAANLSGDFGGSTDVVLAFHAYLLTFGYDAIESRARIESYGSANCAAFECPGESWFHTFDFATDGILGWTKRQVTDPDFYVTGGEGIWPTTTVSGTFSQNVMYLKRNMPYADGTTRLLSMETFWGGLVLANSTVATEPSMRNSTMNSALAYKEGETTAPMISGYTGSRKTTFSGTTVYLNTDFLRLFFSNGARTATPTVFSEGYVVKVVIEGQGKNPFVA